MIQAIKLQGVTKLYPNGKGIHDVSLTVEKGKIFGFLGPNGAGKTTAIRTIMDFMKPSAGTITIHGLDSHADSVKLKEIIGYLPADRQLYPSWTGEEHVDFYAKLRKVTPRNDIAKRLHLDLSQKVSQLSTGNKQKLALALALVGSPKLLVMDEPTNGLDPLFQQEIYEILQEYKHSGGTILLSSHNLPEVEKICDSVGVIKEGRMVAVESMQSIRDMSIHIVSITSKGILPIEQAGLANVEMTHKVKNHIMLKVRGDLNPLLKFVGRHVIHDIEITHANLEDIFLEYYR